MHDHCPPLPRRVPYRLMQHVLANDDAGPGSRPPHASRAWDGSDACSPLARRLIAAIVAVGCATILGLAAYMTPSSTGLGTHSQLNLPACGWITLMDVPCVTCGMTTSFSHAARGEFLRSFLAQPLGFLLALATAIAFIVSLHVALTGSRLAQPLARLWCASTAWLIAALALGAWLFKIASYKGIV